MGSFHGETLAQRLPGARLAAIADPAPGAAEKLAAALGASAAYTDAADAFASPEVDAVVIAAPARFHADLVAAAAEAGKGVFCEKPMGLALADVDRAAARVPPGLGAARGGGGQGCFLREADGVGAGGRGRGDRRRARRRRRAAGRLQPPVRPGLGRGPGPAGRRHARHAADGAVG